MDSEMGNTSFISTLITAAASLFLESKSCLPSRAGCPLSLSRRAAHTQQGQGSEIEFPSSSIAAAAARIMT